MKYLDFKSQRITFPRESVCYNNTANDIMVATLVVGILDVGV